MIIGTAGHIDHGKTALVRALTGVDTDRLPEEKARGISIDLGYAYAPLSEGGVLGFVDVPGHEKFIHAMLAGATGIDFALLVVAADDGVMPQTREHLDILALLGIARGAIALTKIDTVDEARAAEVRDELQSLVAGTPLRDAKVHAVSTRTGTGIDALRTVLEAEAGCFARHADDRHFRLAVDRSFTLPGIGTVVTGTVHAGEIRVGSDAVVAPSGHAVRVRSIHAQNRVSDRGIVGQRCALNLAGIARDAVGRGDWIVAAPIALSTARFDATLVILPGDNGALAGAAHVHIHLGAAHAVGRLVPLGDVTRNGSASRLVQVVLQHPIATWRGDRFIVRDASASRTIGGGTVIDPLAPGRYRKSPERLAILAALAEPSPGARIARLLDESAN
ncbi:MAG TPA: selenocysteine-specific translation elongation factor, partial [Caldimonas sp.]|nr:selenocysteine-specific translation elongation factor [Caldimonas sp.]